MPPPSSAPGSGGFSYAKVLMFVWAAQLSYISCQERQFVQGFIAMLLTCSTLYTPNGEVYLLMPFALLSERCLHSVLALGHGPVMLYASCLLSYLLSSMEAASVKAKQRGLRDICLYGATGVVTLALLTRDVWQCAGMAAFVVVGLVAFVPLRETLKSREGILLAQLAGFYACDVLINSNLTSADALAVKQVTSFPHVGGRCAMVVAMLVAAGMRWTADIPHSLASRASLRFVMLFATFLGIGIWHTASVFEENPFVWLWAYVLSSRLRTSALALWFSGIPLAILGIALFGSSFTKVVRRKLFHLIAVVAFTPFLVLDSTFVSFSFSVCVALAVLLETARVHRVAGTHRVTRFVEQYTDERDGGVVRTHIYLMFGLVWSVIFHHRQELLLSRATPLHLQLCVSLLPGIVTVGVVDAAAAVVGSGLGGIRNNNNNNNTSLRGKKNGVGLLADTFCNRVFPLVYNPSFGHKTRRGTIGGILVGCAFWLMLLFVLRVSFAAWWVLYSLFLIAAAGVAEAAMSGVDNIELPFIVLGLVQTLFSQLLKQ